MIDEGIYSDDEKLMLSACRLCPRECGVNRFETAGGFCGTDAGLNIASICIHRGEEPPISGTTGICNIFFAGCNMRCIYCQNNAISRPEYVSRYSDLDLSTSLDIVEKILSRGIKAVGFVSPSHMIPQMKAIIRGLNNRGLDPIIVYNTNSYDKVETLRDIADMVDVYLPDYKYVSESVSVSLSRAPGYPEIALKALKEMYFQKGSVLLTDDEGVAYSGLLIRHLILPGQTTESIKVLRLIAEELSLGVHISLMSQYYPNSEVRNHEMLYRPLEREEYDKVVGEMERLGFRNGWLQDPESFNNYLPDFNRENPFEY